jgi:VWFA-related protein
VGSLFLLVTAAHADGPVQVTQVDPSQFPEVAVYVSVTDPGGELRTGLTKDDFQLLEDGKPVEIKDFAGAEQPRPVDIVFVFDTTGSMEEQIEGVKDISIAFANKLREHNRDFRLGLVAFGDEIRTVRNADNTLTADAGEFKGWISELWADGGDDDPEISLDALQRAAQMTYRAGTQKVLILITDAPPHERGDGTPFSRVVSSELVGQLRDQGFTVYAVAYDDGRFRRLANETRGEFYDINLEPDFTGIIDQIGGIISAQYRLTYISARPFHDGTWRSVEVTVGGEKGASVYMEEHLINIRSNGLIALFFALPLLAALALPTVVGLVLDSDQVKTKGPHPQPTTGEAAPASMGSQLPAVEKQVAEARATAGTAQAVCSRCGSSLRPGARFCGQCGQAITTVAPPVPPAAAPRAATCPRCGRTVRPGGKFCGNCGQKMG